MQDTRHHTYNFPNSRLNIPVHEAIRDLADRNEKLKAVYWVIQFSGAVEACMKGNLSVEKDDVLFMYLFSSVKVYVQNI